MFFLNVSSFLIYFSNIENAVKRTETKNNKERKGVIKGETEIKAERRLPEALSFSCKFRLEVAKAVAMATGRPSASPSLSVILRHQCSGRCSKLKV